MAKRRRSLLKLLGSPSLAIGLMVYLALVSVLGTLMPQGASQDARVALWAAANPRWEGWAQRLGLHSVYTSWYFLIGAALLAASTAVCAWRRTKVARARRRLLSQVRALRDQSPRRPDYSVPLLGAGASRDSSVMERVESALAGLGVSGARRGDVFVAASSPWSVWWSPLFHWALVLIFCTLAVGSLFRAEGLMGVPEGESIKDEAAAYRVLTVGPLHSWSATDRRVLLNGLRLDYAADGMNRGTSPDVSVLDGSGAVLARQVVYPNNALHYGSLTIHSSAWGLSPKFELLDQGGRTLGVSSAILDFPSRPTGSTDPGDIEFTGADGQVALVARVTMPLERNVTVAEAMAANPKVRVKLLTPEGKNVGGGTLSEGEKLKLPDGSSLRLARVGFYARLSVVDDPTIPLLYASLLAALVGVAFALLARQRLIVVEYCRHDDEPRLEAFTRLWRNAGVTAKELEDALKSVASPESKENPVS